MADVRPERRPQPHKPSTHAVAAGHRPARRIAGDTPATPHRVATLLHAHTRTRLHHPRRGGLGRAVLTHRDAGAVGGGVSVRGGQRHAVHAALGGVFQRDGEGEILVAVALVAGDGLFQRQAGGAEGVHKAGGFRAGGAAVKHHGAGAQRAVVVSRYRDVDVVGFVVRRHAGHGGGVFLDGVAVDARGREDRGNQQRRFSSDLHPARIGRGTGLGACA